MKQFVNLIKDIDWNVTCLETVVMQSNLGRNDVPVVHGITQLLVI